MTEDDKSSTAHGVYSESAWQRLLSGSAGATAIGVYMGCLREGSAAVFRLRAPGAGYGAGCGTGGGAGYGVEKSTFGGASLAASVVSKGGMGSTPAFRAK